MEKVKCFEVVKIQKYFLVKILLDSYRGMWEVPLNQWDDGTTSYTCSYFDACFRSLIDGDSESVYRLFMDNFIKFYKDRKQPFTAFGHGAFFDHSSFTWRIEGKSTQRDGIP